jgi:hypothetical protein
MIQCKDVQAFIDEHAENGALQPESMAGHLQKCKTCREYQRHLSILLETLDRIEIPAPPETLVADVMEFIDAQEPEPVEVEDADYGELLWDTWRAFCRLLPRFELPDILHREAVPVSLATLAVVWQVLIAPSVEAGRTDAFFNHPLLQEVDRYAEQIKERGEQAADRVRSLASEVITKAYQEVADESPTEARMERTQEYLAE